MSEVKVNKVSPRSGTGLQLGDSGDTITIPSGATLANSGTVTGIPTSALTGTIALNQMATGTDGNIISYDASGNPVAVATGTAGQILTSAGAGAPPTFATAAAGGKVLQVVQGTDTASRSSSSTSYVTGTINAAITPSATGSKVLVHITGTMRNGTFNIFRGASDLGGGQGFGQTNGDENISAIHYLDSPSTTSATTYTGYMKASNGGVVYFGVGGYTVITLMEIGA